MENLEILLFSDWNDTVTAKYPRAAFLLEMCLSRQDIFSAPGSGCAVLEFQLRFRRESSVSD